MKLLILRIKSQPLSDAWFLRKWDEFFDVAIFNFLKWNRCCLDIIGMCLHESFISENKLPEVLVFMWKTKTKQTTIVPHQHYDETFSTKVVLKKDLKWSLLLVLFCDGYFQFMSLNYHYIKEMMFFDICKVAKHTRAEGPASSEISILSPSPVNSFNTVQNTPPFLPPNLTATTGTVRSFPSHCHHCHHILLVLPASLFNLAQSTLKIAVGFIFPKYCFE